MNFVDLARMREEVHRLYLEAAAMHETAVEAEMLYRQAVLEYCGAPSATPGDC